MTAAGITVDRENHYEGMRLKCNMQPEAVRRNNDAKIGRTLVTSVHSCQSYVTATCKLTWPVETTGADAGIAFTVVG